MANYNEDDIDFDAIINMRPTNDTSVPTFDYSDNINPKTILSNPSFLADVRDVMASQGQFFDNDEDMIDEFFSERNWRDMNLAAAAFGDAGALATARAAPDTREKMGRIQKVFTQYPMFWQDGGRGWLKGLSDAVPAALLAVENLFPGISGYKVGAAAAKAGASGLVRGAGKGAAVAAGTEAILGAGISATNQATDLVTGAQDEFSTADLAIEAGLGAGLGGVLGGVIGGVGGAMGARTTRQQMAMRDVLLETKEARLKADPSADTSDLDEELEKVYRAMGEAPTMAPDSDTEPEPEVTPDVEVEEPAQPKSMFDGPDGFDAVDFESMAQEELIIAEAINDDYGGELGQIAEGIGRERLNDPSRPEIKADFKEFTLRIGRAGKYRSLMARKAEYDELSEKIASAKSASEVAKLETARAKIEVSLRGILKAKRQSDSALADAVDTQVEDLSEFTGEGFKKRTSEPEAPFQPSTEGDFPTADAVQERMFQSDLEGAPTPEVETPAEAPVVEGQAFTADTLPEFKDNAEDFVNEMLFDSVPTVRQNFINSLDKNANDPSAIIKFAELRGKKLDLAETKAALQKLKGEMNTSFEGDTPDPVSSDAPRLQGKEFKAYESRLMKAALSGLDLSRIEGDQIREQFVSGLMRIVRNSNDGERLAQDVSEPRIRSFLVNTAKERYKIALETNDKGTASALGKDDAQFFDNKAGKRIGGLGGVDRTGRVQSGDKSDLSELIAEAEINAAYNDTLSIKDQELGKEKPVVVEAVAKARGRIRANQSINSKDTRYNAGDIIRWDNVSKKAEVRQVDARQRSTTPATDPVEAIMSISNPADFSRALGEMFASGRIDFNRADELTARWQQENMPAVDEPPVDTPPAPKTEDGGIPTEDVAQGEAAPTPEPAEAPTPAPSTRERPLQPMRTKLPEGIPSIPEGRVFAARAKLDPLPNGVQPYKYVIAGEPSQNQQMRDGTYTIEQIIGKRGRGMEWEFGTVESEAGLRPNNARRNEQFTPLGEEPAAPKQVTKPDQINTIPVLDADYLEANPKFNELWSERNALELTKFDETLSDFDKTLARLQEIESALPEHRLPEVKRSEAWASLNRILKKGNVPIEDIIAAKDVLRRITNANRGMAPSIAETTLIGRFSRDNSTLKIGGDPKKTPSPQYNVLAHELFHWAYQNVISPSDKASMLSAVRKYYAPDGKLDRQKLQEALPYKLDNMSADNPQEFLAGQFEMYINQQLPYAENVFQKVGRMVFEVIERFFPSIMGGKSRVDPEIAEMFHKLLPENQTDFLATTREATTAEGLSINNFIDGFRTRRRLIEDTLSQETYIDYGNIGQHVAALQRIMFGEDPNFDPAILKFLDKDAAKLKFAEIEAIDFNGDSDLVGTQAGNILIDLYDDLDFALMDAFREIEGTNAPDPDMILPDFKNSDPKTMQNIQSPMDWEQRDEMRTLTKAFRDEFREALATQNRPAISAVLEQYAVNHVGKYSYAAKGKRLQNWILRGITGGQRRALPLQGQKTSREMLAVAGVKTEKDGVPTNDLQVAKYADMTDEEFIKSAKATYNKAMQFLKDADERFGWKITTQETNARNAIIKGKGYWDEARGLMMFNPSDKKTSNVSKTEATKNRRRKGAQTQANKAVKNKDVKPSVNTSPDTETKSATNKQLDKELANNPDPQRKEDIGAEFIRRLRAMPEFPDTAAAKTNLATMTMPTAELETRLKKAANDGDSETVQSLAYDWWLRHKDKTSSGALDAPTFLTSTLIDEANAYRGASEIDGVPNNARGPEREAIRKLTHRDRDTQRVGRGIMYRLISLSKQKGGDPLGIDTGNYDSLRNELRGLASSLTGAARQYPMSADETIRRSAQLTLRVSPLDPDEALAVREAYQQVVESGNAPDLGIVTPNMTEQDMANTWFRRTLENSVLGRSGFRPFKGIKAAEANDALEARVQKTAYLINGMMGRSDVRKSGSRLTLYGDMFANVSVKPSPERIANERAFVAGGLGADENGNPITYYHATPNAKGFEADDAVFRASGPQSHYGRGRYVSVEKDVVGKAYGGNPTEASLRSLVDSQITDNDKIRIAYDVIERLVEARAATKEFERMTASGESLDDVQMRQDLQTATMGQEGNDPDFFTMPSFDFDEWLEMEGDMLRALEDLGVKMSTGIIETRIQAVSPLDLRETTVLDIGQTDFAEVMISLEQMGGLSDGALDYIGTQVARGDYNGRDWYQDLVYFTERDNDMSTEAAKDALSETFEELGYDSLQVTEYNRVDGPDAIEYEAVVVLDGGNVKSKNAKSFDPDTVFFNNAPTAYEGPMNGSAAGMITDPDMTVDNLIDGIAGSDGSGARQGMFDVMRKMGKKQDLNDKDMRTLSKANPLNFLADNARKLRINGMNWLGDWAKPEKGTGYHEREAAKMALKVMPIMDKLNELGGEGAIKRWGRGLKPIGKSTQPAAFKRIVKAMRRPTNSNIAGLKPEEKAMVQALRYSFAKELNEMKAAGVNIGEIMDNYFPQIWNVERIRENQASFQEGMAAYLLRENMDKPEPMDIDKANDVANQIMGHLLAEDGFYVPQINRRANQNDNIDFTRLIRLNEIGEDGNLKYESVLNFFEENDFLVDDLQSTVAKYFEGTTRRIEMQTQFGTNNHGFYDYLAVRGGGARIAKKLLASDRTVQSTRLHTLENAPGVEVNTTRIPEIKAMSTDEASAAIDEVMTLIQSGKGPATAIARLNQRKPNASRSYKRRVEAIVNGLFEQEKLGAIKDDEVKFAEQYMATLQGRSLDNSAQFNAMRKFSKGMRAFNTVSLLGFTTLTSFTDVALPFVRGASMTNAYQAMRNGLRGPDADEYRKALRSVGATMENIVHQRMAMMYGGSGGRLSNAFFNANLLTPWTNMMREASIATGYEMLKSKAKIAQKYHRLGQTKTRKYRRMKRILDDFGLGDYASNGRDLGDMSLLYEDTRLRAALHKFANESIFTPSKTDVPLWAQDNSGIGVFGSMIFQLKSYPLMFQRLTARTLNEAYRYVRHGDGDIRPLVNMLTIGGLSGAGALAAKDLVQARGGDDESSVDFRKRSLNKIANSMGYEPKLHGDVDEWLGWVVESYVHMGGLGLIADLLYSASRQNESGQYGVNRMTSLVLGPSFGALQSGLTVLQGTSLDEGLNRSAAREIIQRVPIAGGVRYARDKAVDKIAGEADSGSSSGAFGNTFGSSFKSSF